MTERRLMTMISVGLIVGLTLMPVAAGAAQQTAEPAVLNLGWWWEEAQTDESRHQWEQGRRRHHKPFLPAAPGNRLGAIAGACAEGVLPVEIIGGDYETPNKLAALSFDLSYLTPGSEVFRFDGQAPRGRGGLLRRSR